METGSFMLRFTSSNVSNEHKDLSKFVKPIATNKKIPGEFGHEYGNRVIEYFIAMKSKLHSFVTQEQCSFTKEKAIQKDNKDSIAEYYNALMNNKVRIVNEGWTQKVGDKMITLQTWKTALSFFDAKQF